MATWTKWPRRLQPVFRFEYFHRFLNSYTLKFELKTYTIGRDSLLVFRWKPELAHKMRVGRIL